MMFQTDAVHTLISLPATDLNFVSSLKNATSEEIESALDIMRNREGKDKGRIKACERELRRMVKSVNKDLVRCSKI